jgi:hypothetical protein
MSRSFDPKGRSVVVDARITGPRNTTLARLILDTGASATLIRPWVLEAVGYALGSSPGSRRLRSATGGGSAPVVVARQLTALGHARIDFPVAAYDLPPAVTVDGLLGLDFLRGRVLTLDFARGRVGLRGPRRWWPWG